MGSRKQISVNLRDLQRVLDDPSQRLPVRPSGDDSEAAATESAPKILGSKGFDYKLSSNRWGCEEDDDDDFLDIRPPKNDLMEADLATSWREAPPKDRMQTTQKWGGASNDRRKEVTGYKGQGKPSYDDQGRNRGQHDYNGYSNDQTSGDDDWRRPSVPTNSGTSKSGTGKFGDRQESNETFGRDMNGDAGSNWRSTKTEKYVAPSQRKTGGASENAGVNDRFSCLQDNDDDGYRGYDRSSGAPDFGSGGTRSTVFAESFGQRTQQMPDAFKNISSASKTGKYIPVHRRGQAQQQQQSTSTASTITATSSVHDIFKKAANLSHGFEANSRKQSVSASSSLASGAANQQVDLQLLEKRKSILAHNRMYECSNTTVELVVDAANRILDGQAVGDVATLITNKNDLGSLVPAIVCVLVASKRCSSACSSFQDVVHVFKPIAPFLKQLLEHAPWPRVLILELVKIVHAWDYPALSPDLHLLEALFYALLVLQIIDKSEFKKFFEVEVDQVPDRSSVLFQLMAWKRWLNDEQQQQQVNHHDAHNQGDPSAEDADYEDMDDDEDEEDDEDDDDDIEANVPKPIRLKKYPH